MHCVVDPDFCTSTSLLLLQLHDRIAEVAVGKYLYRNQGQPCNAFTTRSGSVRGEVPCSGTVAQWIRIIKILTISEDAEKRYLRCSAGHFNAEFSQTSSGSSAMGQSTNMSFHLLGGNNIRMSEKANRFVVTRRVLRVLKKASVCASLQGVRSVHLVADVHG